MKNILVFFYLIFFFQFLGSGSVLFAQITGSYELTETILSPRSGPFFQPTMRDNRPTSAVSALIFGLFLKYSLFALVQMYQKWPICIFQANLQ